MILNWGDPGDGNAWHHIVEQSQIGKRANFDANKCFDELEKLIIEFKAENDLESLFVLLEHPNDGVKLETASKLLSLYPVKSVQVLESLAIKKGIFPFTAKQTLKQWKAGKMRG